MKSPQEIVGRLRADNLTYAEAIQALRLVDSVRNGDIEVEDVDAIVDPVLDAMPAILRALDPSRTIDAWRGDPSADVLTQVANAMWVAAWQACNTSNRGDGQDLFQGKEGAIAAAIVDAVLKNAPLDPSAGGAKPAAELRELREAALACTRLCRWDDSGFLDIDHEASNELTDLGDKLKALAAVLAKKQ